jgi:hypothetical protein
MNPIALGLLPDLAGFCRKAVFLNTAFWKFALGHFISKANQ